MPDALLARYYMVRRSSHLSISTCSSVPSAVPGIVIVLFFRCLSALLSTTERSRGGVRWGFVAHTAAMFSLVTIYTAINLEIQSISNIDNREFPGTDVMPPGPFGYELFISSTAIGVVPTIMFQLNTWLADGLLVSSVFNLSSQEFDNSFPSSIVVVSLIP